MNLSGPPVNHALKSLRLGTANLVVIHDALEVAPEVLKYRFGGSPMGHNGVRSVIAALKNDKGFHRLKIGIGRPESDLADNIAKYVLSDFSSHERQFWQSGGRGVDIVWHELQKIANTGRGTR